MKRLDVRELHASFDELKDLLEQDGEVTLTLRGKPIARVLPLSASRTQMPSLKAFRARQTRQSVPSSAGIRQDRDAR